MLGPFIQGFMLVGVIYFYSKSILLLINDYYRDEFKTELQKDIKKLEEFKQIRETIEEGKGKIVNKKDIIPSPTIEGIPDIFHSPERTSLVISREETTKTKNHLNNNHYQLKKLAKYSDDGILISDNKVNKIIEYPKTPPLTQQQTNHEDANECSSSINIRISSSCSNQEFSLLDSAESCYSNMKSRNIHNDVLKDGNKESILNLLPVNELSYENQIRKQRIKSDVVDVDVSTSCNSGNGNLNINDKNEGGGRNKLLHKHYDLNEEVNTQHRQQCHQHQEKSILPSCGKYDRINELKSRVDKKKLQQRLLEVKKYGTLTNEVSNVCNIRRKSVNEMVQYWNHQVSVYEENLKTEEKDKPINGKRRKSIDVNINGVV